MRMISCAYAQDCLEKGGVNMIDLENEARASSESGIAKYDDSGQDEEKSAPDHESSSKDEHSTKDRFWNKQGKAGEQTSSKLDFVMTAGVLLPLAIIAVTLVFNLYSACGVLWRHWLETLVQFALILSIPLGNYYAWKKIKKGDLRRASLLGCAIGVAGTTSLLASLLLSAAVFLGYPMQDAAGFQHAYEFLFLAGTAWFAFSASLVMARRYRNVWSTRGARFSAAVQLLLGALLACFTLSATEAKSACIRIAESMTSSTDPGQSREGLKFLQTADCERSLLMDCSNPSTCGLTEMFLRFDTSQSKKLYFLTTGRPFPFDLQNSNDYAALPDEMLGKQVVGNKLAGLSMAHSLISGMVHPQSLTSTIDWTFVFKNSGYDQKEARAEIGLPKDAVVSEMVLWINGVPKRAIITSSEVGTQAYQWVTYGRRDPALVTDLGKGRVLIQCNPVPPQGEIRVKISMKSPLKLDS